MVLNLLEIPPIRDLGARHGLSYARSSAIEVSMPFFLLIPALPTLWTVAAAAVVGTVAVAVAKSTAQSFTDNVIRDKVDVPARGGIVFCDLYTFDHSGIYVDGKIVHMTRDGKICQSWPNEFLANGGYIYTTCRDGKPVGSEQAADLAQFEYYGGSEYEYNVLTQNCHMFTSYCVTGSWSRDASTFGGLEKLAEREIGSNNWRSWSKDCWIGE
jgi:hypothetical protein